MEKCKFCQAELAENGTFCSNCGKNNAEEAEETVIAAEAAVEETAKETAEETTKETASEETAPAEAEAAP